ncbi:replication endonuclease [Rodentibacter pneumotropicus]|uniref:Replication endonuclease n=2 Tax=Rodentibacter pneumotropicus TaxID=758 RepID=A0A4S2QBH6_9PAST|nr:replication endonuclease [Rodentibacter pneumotropicus]NBH76363.1 replication endonuclease [Rodentibacter pneumotropicus]THA04122.1 replication endonuclease [Rodentibacter pneumotropicus]THA10730.1 replication endonuclease [Rodentibacter pneumotropicus]THA14253.1 replication endonuclease [Rodentibacter pneumotropicus]
MQQTWEQQRDTNITAKQAHMAVVARERNQAAKNGENLHNPLPHEDKVYTTLQLELFATNPVDFEFIEKKLAKLPRQRQREHFRKLYLNAYHSVQDDGSIAFALGNKQRRHANNFLREVLDVRLQQVMAQYNIDVAYLQAFLDKPRWLADLKADLADEAEIRHLVKEGKAEAQRYYTVPTRAEKSAQQNELKKIGENAETRAQKQITKGKLPFYLIGESKLKEIAYQIADGFSNFQLDYAQTIVAINPIQLTHAEMNACFFELYKKCGHIALSFGFPLPHWDKAEKNKPIKGEKIDVVLEKICCHKFWFKRMRAIQNQMTEHIAIACGEVRKGVSSYISFGGLNRWIQQQRKNYDYLRAMILENVENPEEQIELFDTFIKSSACPAIRRIELMNRWRGIETWADHNGYIGLFLTLTAPSAYHAVLSKSGKNNPKWNGSSPKQTHEYLNRIWQQMRAIYNKRKMIKFGIRVAEPHQDGTPHWHILVYVKPERKEEFIEIFRRKALEEDGDEKGAAENRIDVKECDKEKGSATAYLVKYVSKNIDGFALDNETSDEDPDLNLKLNAKRVRAWASTHRIRQFQFFGAGTIGIYRELRRLINGQCEDEIIEKARLGCDLGDFAFFFDLQGGAETPRSEQPLQLDYEEKAPNQYGEVHKAVIGVKNKFTDYAVKTRLKKYIIKKRPKDFTSSSVEHSETEKSERSSPWTCVNNCNRSKIEQKIKMLLTPICAPLNEQKLDYLFKYKRLAIDKYTALELTENDVQLVKRNQNMMATLTPVPRNIQKLKDFHKKQRIQ